MPFCGYHPLPMSLIWLETPILDKIFSYSNAFEDCSTILSSVKNLRISDVREQTTAKEFQKVSAVNAVIGPICTERATVNRKAYTYTHAWEGSKRTAYPLKSET